MTSDELLEAAAVVEATAERCTGLALSLADITSPLPTVLSGVETEHTPATWTGRSADRSRERLAMHAQVIAAVSQDVGAFVDELDGRARDLRWHADQLRLLAAQVD